MKGTKGNEGHEEVVYRLNDPCLDALWERPLGRDGALSATPRKQDLAATLRTVAA